MCNERREFSSFFSFLEYRDFIPFVQPAPIDEAETKKAKKQKEGMKKKGGDTKTEE